MAKTNIVKPFSFQFVGLRATAEAISRFSSSVAIRTVVSVILAFPSHPPYSCYDTYHAYSVASLLTQKSDRQSVLRWMRSLSAASASWKWGKAELKSSLPVLVLPVRSRAGIWVTFTNETEARFEAETGRCRHCPQWSSLRFLAQARTFPCLRLLYWWSEVRVLQGTSW